MVNGSRTSLRYVLKFAAREKTPWSIFGQPSDLTRRVLCVKELSNEHILLDVQRLGRARPGRLEFLCAGAPRPAGRISREQFCTNIRLILAESFPAASIESLTVRS